MAVPEARKTRPASWITAARNEFGTFPEEAQSRFLAALAFRGGVSHVVYAVQLADEIRLIHAFQKMSKQGAATSAARMRIPIDGRRSTAKI